LERKISPREIYELMTVKYEVSKEQNKNFINESERICHMRDVLKEEIKSN